MKAAAISAMLNCFIISIAKQMSGNLSYKQEVIDDADSEYSPSEPEICFRMPETTELRLGMEKHDTSTLEYLRYCVARNPSDLISHLRRIILLDEMGDAENLYSALIDIFIALGANGVSLRSRLLKQYRAKLSEHHYKLLSDWLQGNRISLPTDINCDSVLTKGITGTCSLVKTGTDIKKEESATDPLQEAREYLEYSQIEEARCVLEKAVLEHPERKDLQTELLELYRAVRDSANFQRIHEKLIASGVELSDDWSTVSDFLSENA